MCLAQTAASLQFIAEAVKARDEADFTSNRLGVFRLKPLINLVTAEVDLGEATLPVSGLTGS